MWFEHLIFLLLREVGLQPEKKKTSFGSLLLLLLQRKVSGQLKLSELGNKNLWVRPENTISICHCVIISLELLIWKTLLASTGLGCH